MATPDAVLDPLASAGAPPALGAMRRALVDAALDLRHLPAKIAHLALSMTYQNKGAVEEARRHGELALQAGLTKPEVAEAMLAGVLSRGDGVVSGNQWLLDTAPDAPWADPRGGEPMTTEQILDYFAGNFGDVPSWLRSLAAASGPTLEAYHAMRSESLRDAVLPRRHKELILVVINSSERYQFGMEVHMRGAVDAGWSSRRIARGSACVDRLGRDRGMDRGSGRG